MKNRWVQTYTLPKGKPVGKRSARGHRPSFHAFNGSKTNKRFRINSEHRYPWCSPPCQQTEPWSPMGQCLSSRHVSCHHSSQWAPRIPWYPSQRTHYAHQLVYLLTVELQVCLWWRSTRKASLLLWRRKSPWCPQAVTGFPSPCISSRRRQCKKREHGLDLWLESRIRTWNKGHWGSGVWSLLEKGNLAG